MLQNASSDRMGSLREETAVNLLVKRASQVSLWRALCTSRERSIGTHQLHTTRRMRAPLRSGPRCGTEAKTPAVSSQVSEGGAPLGDTSRDSSAVQFHLPDSRNPKHARQREQTNLHVCSPSDRDDACF